MPRKAVAGALGNCVHVAGVINFLRLAEMAGYETVFLGPACDVKTFIEAIREHDPELVGVSYRLSPHVVHSLIDDFQEQIKRYQLHNRRFAFAGTPPVCEEACKSEMFDVCFNGHEEPEEVFAYIKGEPRLAAAWELVHHRGADAIVHNSMEKLTAPELQDKAKGLANWVEECTRHWAD